MYEGMSLVKIEENDSSLRGCVNGTAHWLPHYYTRLPFIFGIARDLYTTYTRTTPWSKLSQQTWMTWWAVGSAWSRLITSPELWSSWSNGGWLRTFASKLGIRGTDTTLMSNSQRFGTCCLAKSFSTVSVKDALALLLSDPFHQL